MAQDSGGQQISCRHCKHYRISWDPHAPHACTAMGFKSRQLPSVVVFESSGIECQLYQPKPPSHSKRS